MNINSILFDLKESYATKRRVQMLEFDASASNGICKYVIIAGCLMYSEILGGYRLFMTFWCNGIAECTVSTGHIDDELRFIKACIALIDEITNHYPVMQEAELTKVTRKDN